MEVFMKIALIIFVLFANVACEEEGCLDIDGRDVVHGLWYVPGPNVCRQCVCHHSEPKWCQTMFCNGPPYTCKNYTVGKTCCQFECHDPPTEKPPVELMRVQARSCSTTASTLLVVSALMVFFQVVSFNFKI